MTNNDKFYIGDRLNQLLEEKMMSRTELFKLIKRKKDSIDDWCECVQNPAIGTIVRIAEVFNVSLDWLITGEEFNGQRR